MCQIRCVNCTWSASFSWRVKEAALWFESYGSKNLTGGTTWSSQSTSTDWLTRTHHWSSPRSKLSYKKPTSTRKLRKFLVTSGQGSKHRDWTASRWWARWRSQSSLCQHHVITWRGLIPADHEYLDSVAWPCHDCEVAPVWHHDVTNPRTCQFSAVCLTVFPFEFRPRTFTIGFYEKKLYHIRAYDFGVQFSFKVALSQCACAAQRTVMQKGRCSLDTSVRGSTSFHAETKSIPTCLRTHGAWEKSGILNINSPILEQVELNKLIERKVGVTGHFEIFSKTAFSFSNT